MKGPIPFYLIIFYLDPAEDLVIYIVSYPQLRCHVGHARNVDGSSSIHQRTGRFTLLLINESSVGPVRPLQSMDHMVTKSRSVFILYSRVRVVPLSHEDDADVDYDGDRPQVPERGRNFQLTTIFG